jgi:uncharacterized protein RhaS with RHS repeats
MATLRLGDLAPDFEQKSSAPTHYYGYLPFGEIMVEHNNSNYDSVYKFNGKELDESTGYYYYGARYYNPSTSIFLSVDP